MDTFTRSTLIARSTRSLSGVLIASILGLTAQTETTFASESSASSLSDSTVSTNYVDTVDHTNQAINHEMKFEGFLASDPSSSISESNEVGEDRESEVLDTIEASEEASETTVLEAIPEFTDSEETSGATDPADEQPQVSQQFTPYPFDPREEVDPLYEDEYVLGPQDQIQIDIFDVPEFSGPDGQHTILVDGTVNFPWIGNVPLDGLTLTQAATQLEQEYAPYINDPLITISLLRPRAIRISVVGEVNRPGSYTLDPIERVVERVNNVDAAEGNNQWTSLVQAIQTAGGITQTANIREIQIQRPSRPDDEQIITVSLWDLLQDGDLRQDLALRDGDTIYVPRATALDAEEYLEVAEANFSPDFINAYVIGEVKEPGVLEVQPDTTITQAILAAGGFENNRAGRVELIRLNSDGTVEKRDIDVDFAADLNEETNPPLRDRDIILVGRSSGARIVDFLDTLFSPITDVVDSIFGIFPIDLIGDDGD